jgi:NADH:ubiquinone oxidoreductase subunit 2 (subunit N)
MDERGQMMGPRISVAVATAVLLLGIVLSQFYTESTAFREATRDITANDPNALLLPAAGLVALGIGVVISWWRGGVPDVDG